MPHFSMRNVDLMRFNIQIKSCYFKIHAMLFQISSHAISIFKWCYFKIRAIFFSILNLCYFKIQVMLFQNSNDDISKFVLCFFSILNLCYFKFQVMLFQNSSHVISKFKWCYFKIISTFEAQIRGYEINSQNHRKFNPLLLKKIPCDCCHRA